MAAQEGDSERVEVAREPNLVRPLADAACRKTCLQPVLGNV
jgi:hypothetical protein